MPRLLGTGTHPVNSMSIASVQQAVGQGARSTASGGILAAGPTQSGDLGSVVQRDAHAGVGGVAGGAGGGGGKVGTSAAAPKPGGGSSGALGDSGAGGPGTPVEHPV